MKRVETEIHFTGHIQSFSPFSPFQFVLIRIVTGWKLGK